MTGYVLYAGQAKTSSKKMRNDGGVIMIGSLNKQRHRIS